MQLKKIFFALTTAAALSSTAMASEHVNQRTVMLGYQQGHLEGFGKLQGGNFRFQYETATPWGVMGSLTAMKKDWGNEKYPYDYRNKRWGDCCTPAKNMKAPVRNAEYFSAMAGPTYRVSEYVSLFALGGVSHTKVDKPLISGAGPYSLEKNGSESSNEFAYSTGITVNPTEKIAVTVGYEGSKAGFSEKKHNMNSVFMNVGFGF